MKGIVLWVSLGIFLISGITLLEWQQSEATDYSGSTIPTNSTSGLIEEEKEEDEINQYRLRTEFNSIILTKKSV
jgi:hypothetical protein